MTAKPFTKGERCGILTILGETKKVGRIIYEKCLCDCGNEKFISRRHLRRGASKSCGCVAIKKSKERLMSINTKHGMYGTTFYKRYIQIRYRCTNPHASNYKSYGGRGIKCKRSSFEEFYNDMYESYKRHVAKYGEKETTIDRINVDGDYCKENCRWATNLEQQRNRRDCIRCTYKGKEYDTLLELCNELGLTYYIVRQRIYHGWGLNKAIETPIRKRFTS